MTNTGIGKNCTSCGEWKLVEHYHIAKNGKMGRAAKCKPCRKAMGAQYYSENKEEIYRRNEDWRERNPEKYNEIQRLNNEKYYQTKLVNLKEKYWADPDKARESLRRKRREKPENTREQNKRSNAKRLLEPKFRVEKSIRNGIRQEILSGSKKGRTTFTLLGYTPADLFAHLERQFAGGMTWDNYGTWHIDHIIPLSAFNYETPDDIDFRKAWDLSNLRPLWAVENLRKGSKLMAPFQPSLALALPVAANDNNQISTKDAA